MKVTVHSIVKNEENFIWYSLNSVLPYVDEILVWDTGSTDNTKAIIKKIPSQKIKFTQKSQIDAKQLVNLRNQQIAQTRSEFFLLLDGDEVWHGKNLQKLFQVAETMLSSKMAVFCRTRNAVGDIFHYLPENAGKYQLGGQTGHLNLRLFRKVPNLEVRGSYPMESYCLKGKPLNDQNDKLEFADTWYLHLTHLLRSQKVNETVLNRQGKFKFELGLTMSKNDLPEVFWEKAPDIVPPLQDKRNAKYLFQAAWQTPLRVLKRKVSV